MEHMQANGCKEYAAGQPRHIYPVKLYDCPYVCIFNISGKNAKDVTRHMAQAHSVTQIIVCSPYCAEQFGTECAMKAHRLGCRRAKIWDEEQVEVQRKKDTQFRIR